MNRKLPPKRWFSVAILVCLFLSPAFLQGCDTFTSMEEAAEAPSTTFSPPKFRHGHLMDRAASTDTDGAGKSNGASYTNLVLGLLVYEADGVTPRVLNKYDVTRRLLNRYGDNLEIKVTVEEAINAITVKINDIILDDFLADMEQDPDIAWVEPDAVFNLPDSGLLTQQEGSRQIIPWSVSRVGIDQKTRGSHANVHVFVLDTGVNTYDLSVDEAVDFTPYVEMRASGNQVDTGRDLSGHGTHIAGIIGAVDNRKGLKGIASGVTIHNLKVMTSSGTTDITTMLAAINHVTLFKLQNHTTPVIVNLSLGVDIGTTEYNALDEAIQGSIGKGVVYVIAAGNDGIDASTYSPAHVTEAITVGSYDGEDKFSSFSNYGSVVDILAPGEMIVSLPYQSQDRESHTYILRSGTSHAAPHVAGIAARYMMLHPNATPAAVREALLNASSADIQGVPTGTTKKTVMLGNWERRR